MRSVVLFITKSLKTTVESSTLTNKEALLERIGNVTARVSAYDLKSINESAERMINYFTEVASRTIYKV
jgi:hypothetical protein